MTLVPRDGHGNPAMSGSQGNASVALVPSRYHQEYSLDGYKTGDVEKERQVVDRMKQLGLYEGKVLLERGLRDRLATAIDRDPIMGAVTHYKRRSRPLAERVRSIVTCIRDVIRHHVNRDRNGRKVSYQVSILMGLFTREVSHRVLDRTQVMVMGLTQGPPRLTKEVTVEFPEDVDMSKLKAGYSAGVFKMEVPFTKRTCSQGELWSSTFSEESMSVTSDTSDHSEVFPMSPTPEPD